MSKQNPGLGSSTTYATARDAKARAKAEKAYRKASRPWYLKKRFWALGFIAFLILISALNGAGDATNAGSSGSTSNKSRGGAPAFPGAESTDVVGRAGDELALGAVAVTAETITEGDSTFSSTLCTEVSVSNNSDETIDFSAFDWKLQAPGGTIVNSGFLGSDNQISGGQVVPGGSMSGDVCFEADTAESGQYVVLYEPIFSFFSDRAAWITRH